MRRFFIQKEYLIAAFAIAAFSFFLYVLTWQGHFGGYEAETASGAKSLLQGTYSVTRAGVGAQLLYVPFLFLFSFLPEPVVWYALTLVPIVYSALTGAICFLIAYGIFKKIRPAAGTALLIVVGSSMWPYANIGMEYQTMFFASLVLFGLLRWKEGSGSLLFPSAMLGALIITKSYGILFGVGYAGFILAHLKEAGRFQELQRMSFLWRAAGIPFACFIGYFFLTFSIKGNVAGAYSLAHEFQIWTWWEGIYGILFSSGKGIFFYCPLLFIVLFFCRRFYYEHRETAVYILSIAVVLFLLTAPFSYWSDETWSVRKLVPVLPFLHLPLGYLFIIQKKMIYRAGAALVIVFAVYVQLLGALYPYGRQLVILRATNIDSLQSMRFIPEASHIPLFHQLLLSYSGIPQTFSYTEQSWFRWTEAGKNDIVFRQAVVPLGQYHTPGIVWAENSPLKRVVFAGIIVCVVFTFGFIIHRYFYCRVRE